MGRKKHKPSKTLASIGAKNNLKQTLSLNPEDFIKHADQEKAGSIIEKIINELATISDPTVKLHTMTLVAELLEEALQMEEANYEESDFDPDDLEPYENPFEDQEGEESKDQDKSNTNSMLDR